MNIQELLRSMGESLTASASVKNVYGDPVTAGERTVIPIAEVRYAFGGGGGTRGGAQAPDGGGGGGGRALLRPWGALEVGTSGTRFIRFDERNRMAIALALGFVVGAAVAALAGARSASRT